MRRSPVGHLLRRIQLVPVRGTFLFPFASHIWGKKEKIIVFEILCFVPWGHK